MSPSDGLSRAELDQWAAGLPATRVPAALLAAGLDDTTLSGTVDVGSGASPPAAWRVERLATVTATEALARAERFGWIGADGFALPRNGAGYRLVLAADPLADHLAARLLQCGAVASVIVEGEQRTRSLGPTHYIGAMPVELVGQLSAGIGDRDSKLSVVTVEPATRLHLDVLVAGPTIDEVLGELETGPAGTVIADVVMLPRTTGRDWAIESLDVDRIRELTDALVIVLVGDDLGPTDLADALVSLAEQRRDTVALDLAVTRSFDRRVLVIGDVAAIEWSGHLLMSGPPPPEMSGAEPPPDSASPDDDAVPDDDAADVGMSETVSAAPDPGLVAAGGPPAPRPSRPACDRAPPDRARPDPA